MLFLTLTLCITCSCGSHAYYLTHGTVGVIEKPVVVQASVPDASGKLQPGVTMTLEPGTEFKGK